MVLKFNKCKKTNIISKENLFVLSSVIFSLVSSSVYAATDANLSRTVYTPYHIKPNMPFYAPSGFSPAQIQKAYGINLIPNQGAGQTIAIVDAYDNPNIESDLGVFSSTFNLPACTTSNGCFQKIYASGTQPPGDTGWGVEIALDVEWAHAIAPQAKIMLVEAANSSISALLQAIQVAVQHGANIVSMSWGAGEFSSEAQYDSYFNIPNVSFTASSGDSGNGVIWPSVSSYVIATGGTTLTLDSSGNYLNETAWAGSGGGLSAYIKLPSYQTNFANKYNPNQMRGIPDVSMVADPNTGVSIYDTYGQGGWLVIGGTSASAPQWAGLLAVVNSATSSPLASLNTLLYSAGTTDYAADYHDIVVGTNGTCGPICSSRSGYDYITGLGSSQFQSLIKTLTGGGGSGTCTRAAPTITYSPNTTQTIQQNGSVTININVVNNDSASCSASTFNLSQSVNSPLITAALTSSSLTINAGGNSGKSAMIIKASNVAVIGTTYTTTVNVADTVLGRPQSFSSQVIIGNSFSH